MKDRGTQNSILGFEKTFLSKVPVVAVVSSVFIKISGENIFLNNVSKATLIFKEDKSFLFWQIDGDDQCVWKDVTRSCAAFGINDFIFIGRAEILKNNSIDAWIIKDHINVSGQNPLIGLNNDNIGTRFPDMTELYNQDLTAQLEKSCKNAGVNFSEGTLLIPKNINNLSKLEKRISELRDDIIFSKDIFSGSITAKHQSSRSAGLLLYESLAELKKSSLLEHILCMF